jgi:hypothetical protein
MKKYMEAVNIMKMKTLNFIGLVVLLLIAGACKKEEVHYYYGGDRIQFKNTNPNPLLQYVEHRSFSFAGKGSLKTHDFIIPVTLTGRTAGVDRQVKVQIRTAETTAVEGVDFKFGEHVLPANSNTGEVHLILLNTEALMEEMKTVSIEIADSDAFKRGLSGQLVSSVSFYNFMVKPIDWDTRMATYLGAYSKVKHEFILNQLGISEINFANGVPEDREQNIYSASTLAYFQLRLRSVLNDLNAGVLQPKENDPFTYPLMDENGVRVVFP